MKKNILDKKKILEELNLDRNFYLFLPVGVAFLIVGLYLIIVSFFIRSENVMTMIFSILLGIVCVGIPLKFIISNRKVIADVSRGNFVILLDELMDDDYYNDNRISETVDRSSWLLFFKDYFKKFNRYVRTNSYKLDSKFKKGKKFYLIFIKGINEPCLFDCNQYVLQSDLKEKIVNIDELERYVNFSKVVITEDVLDSKIILNKSNIIKGFFDKSRRGTLFSYFIILLVLMFFCVGFGTDYGVLAFVIALILFLFFLFAFILNVYYILHIIINIKKGKFEIKKDKVIDLNKGISFRNSNKMISFIFENYKKIVYEEKKNYLNVKVGDKFYLVFVEGEKEPIKIYDAKKSIIE